MKINRKSLPQGSILLPSIIVTKAVNEISAKKIETSDGKVTKLTPKPCICITGNAQSFFGLRLSCSIGRAGGGNHWGNLSKTGGNGPGGVLALKDPAIVAITVRGGNFLMLPGAVAGPSWTGGGADYLCNAPLNSVPAAITYLQRYFKVCACPDAVASLQQHGVDMGNFIICDSSSNSDKLCLPKEG